MNHTRQFRALGLAALVAALTPQAADACGGCFAPPSTVQVVTDHRMVFSVSTTQTTLWDQFSYSGRPAEFSWILPIRYTARTVVQLASDAFMKGLDDLTAPIVQPPTRPFCGNGFPTGGGLDGGAAFDAASAADSGVVVLREEVVGPYAVQIIRGDDPMAIRDWLRNNGYSVPTALDPVIDFYTASHMDFIALRLRPGEGIDRMSPVRVSLEGYQPTLPLRMIAAGVADHVGLSLIVVSEARLEAMNFPNGEISEGDLTWDFNNFSQSASADFLNAFTALNRANGGRLWLTESSTSFSRATVEDYVRSRAFTGGFVDAGAADVGVPTAEPVADVGVAFAGIPGNARITRLRADLAASALDRDLILAASDRGERARLYTYGHTVNAPVCPDGGPGFDVPAGLDASEAPADAPASYDVRTVADAGARPVGDAGADAGPPVPSTAEGGVHCTAQPGAVGSGARWGALLAGLAAVLGIRRRRR